MLRKIIKIDKELCNGCGLCIPECKEGAMQIIDGKATLISDLFCDGLGACLGHCPQGAITIEEREAEDYDEKKVIEKIANEPKAVLKAHLEHLLEHNAMDYYLEAEQHLKKLGIENPLERTNAASHNKEIEDNKQCGCPGSKMVMRETEPIKQVATQNYEAKSELSHWPVQIHLVAPHAPFFKNKELVILSTCSPIASAEIHPKYIKGRAVVVGCPKLDITEPYAEKLAGIFQTANTTKVIVVLMEVPCCRGLSAIVKKAREISGRNDLVIEEHILSLEGKLKTINFI